MTVFLVGAGPGDPGLLTLRGAEALAMADVVVFDRLSVGALLGLAPLAAEQISVAKSAGQAVMAQDDINELLIEKASFRRRSMYINYQSNTLCLFGNMNRILHSNSG